MSNFVIEWTQEQWFRATVEADTKAEAMERFWNGEYKNEKMFGTEIQDSIEVKENN